MRRRTTTRPDAQSFLNDFSFWANPGQLPPEGDWRTWLFLGGRGAGKTRAGAEWINCAVRHGRATRIALVGPALADVREVMIEGPSGLRATAQGDERPSYSVSRRKLTWPNGAAAFAFSAEDPESLRGPQFDLGWCDEVAAWANDEQTWDTFQFGLRIGPMPQVVATTTPRPTHLIRRLLAEEKTGQTMLTRATSMDNARNLGPGVIAHLQAAYLGTRLARQELYGELIEDPDGAMFLRSWIEAGRCSTPPEDMDRVVVAVDPPAGAGPGSDACGIVAAGRKGEIVYVLADASIQGVQPSDWADRVMNLAMQMGAGRIIAEANQGGEMVRQVIRTAAGSRDAPPITLRHATRSKQDRAEPVSVRYAKGEVRHVGVFRELEDEMCAFGAQGGRSPDRVDALVWAVLDLFDTRSGRPSIGVL